LCILFSLLVQDSSPEFISYANHPVASLLQVTQFNNLSLSLSLSLSLAFFLSHVLFNISNSQGLVGAPACGDVMKLQIKVDENGNIQESKFKTFGCGSAIASSSVATEWVKGKHVDEVLSIKNTDIAAHLKLPPVKLHCSMLAEDAIRAAVNDWKAKKESKAKAAAA
jgi:Fe-S cluster assembly scaffold IscU